MIAMQYTIRLAGDVRSEQIHERVANRRCLFDDLQGLRHKSFLYNEKEGIYAPFYVWDCDAPAREFLTGDLFQGLVENFGRPRVRCWSVLAFAEGGSPDSAVAAIKEIDSIPAETRLADLAKSEQSRHEAIRQAPGIGCHLVGIDPDRWEIMRYSTWASEEEIPASEADMIEHYQVLHLSRPLAHA
ncbi:MAG: DUF4865 family protein [Alphaproteobacteria bacterium]|nr:DUF4865 family protein [Alphaproteobacteria bacterium]